MARRYNEKFSLATALKTYLNTSPLTWNIEVERGRSTQTQLETPIVAVSFVPSSSKVGLQMGGGGIKENSAFLRIVQFDAYMESEARAETIIDDIMDFCDLVTIDIVDPSSSTVGYMQVPDSETIYGDTLPPVGENPKLMRWRGVVRAIYEVYYPAS